MKYLASLFLAALSASLCSCTTTEPQSFADFWKQAIATPSDTKKPSILKSKNRRTVRTTAYCHLEYEKGAPYMKNALGTRLRYGSIRSAASDWSRFPVGTQFRIVGREGLYEIDDYGSALAGTDTIDLYMPSLRMMNNWGARYVDIEIVKWGSYEKSAAILSKRTKYKHCRQMYYALLKKI